MGFEAFRSPGLPTGTRNTTAELLPVPLGDLPEVPESGDELLRLSEAISSRLPPEARRAASLRPSKV